MGPSKGAEWQTAAAPGGYCAVSWRGQLQAGGIEEMLPGFSEVKYQTCA